MRHVFMLTITCRPQTGLLPTYYTQQILAKATEMILEDGLLENLVLLC